MLPRGVLVLGHDVFRLAVPVQRAVLEPDHAIADARDRLHVVRDEQHGQPVSRASSRTFCRQRS